MIIVVPSALSRENIFIISLPVRVSRFPVGSSASTIAGLLTMALAMATRWRSPPESSLGLCMARSASPTRSRASLAIL